MLKKKNIFFAHLGPTWWARWTRPSRSHGPQGNLCRDELTTTKKEWHQLMSFSKTRELWRSKANWRLRFSLPSNILADLLGNRGL